MAFLFLPEQLAKGYEGEHSTPQMIQPQTGHQTFENQNVNLNFQPQPFFQTQPFHRQPSFQQMDFKQKVEALTNQFNQNYQNF